MQIFFSPEFINDDSQVLNVVNQNNKPVGYLAFLMDDKKMYVYGHLQEEGICEDFKDLVKHYVEGLSKLKKDLEVYTHLSVGGKSFDVKEEEENS